MSANVVWGGNELLSAFAIATALLEENRATIDALNVYPVPDGDTGTNMSLTMRAALDDARALAGSDPTVRDVANRIAHGSLMGARGNSGVILSQVFRGFANEVSGADRIDGRDLARGLRGATTVAYKAVMRPVEGTMLTVIRVAAEHAEAIAARDPSLVSVLDAAVRGSKAALADTPNLLPALRDAGVVDSGGQGVVLALEGFLAAAKGTTPDISVLTMSGPAEIDLNSDEHDSFGYCTNFMISGTAIPFDRVRSVIAGMGQSAVIVGDDTTVKVHIHSENPGKLLDYAVGWGALSQIKIDNMNAQAAAFSGLAKEHVPVAQSDRAVVAVASGGGIAGAFRSLGVDRIVDGGTTMNPSIDEMLTAVHDVHSREVILLPNNGNVLLAANQIPSLARVAVSVVPTRSVAQGLAAASAFNTDAPIADLVSRMERASQRVTTVEIAQADKDAIANGSTVRVGQFIGLVNDRLNVVSDSLTGCVGEALATVVSDRHELITVFAGLDVPDELAETVGQSIAETYPSCEIDSVRGDQPHYRFIISVE